MKKLMILGASYTQIPLYEAAKRLGVRTIAASIPGEYPGFGIADETAFADIADPEAVIKAAGEHGAALPPAAWTWECGLLERPAKPWGCRGPAARRRKRLPINIK